MPTDHASGSGQRHLATAALGAASLVGAVAIARVVAEDRATAVQRRPATWATTRIVGPPPRGRLAARMAQPVWGPPPTGARPLLSRLVWAAPTTALGLVLAAMSAGTWQWNPELQTLVVSGARSPVMRLAGFQANALGHVVVSRPSQPSPPLLVHEAAHVRQAEFLGPFTLPLYVWWLARDGYRNHPMERGARASARAWLARTG